MPRPVAAAGSHAGAAWEALLPSSCRSCGLMMATLAPWEVTPHTEFWHLAFLYEQARLSIFSSSCGHLCVFLGESVCV